MGYRWMPLQMEPAELITEENMYTNVQEVLSVLFHYYQLLPEQKQVYLNMMFQATASFTISASAKDFAASTLPVHQVQAPIHHQGRM